jgi:hypothetical protein
MKTFTMFSLRISLSAILLCASISLAKAQVPPTSPPDLPHEAENVLSFFSEQYGIAYENTMTDPNWGQSATWDYTGTGDEKLAIVINNLGEKGWLPIALGATTDLKNYYYVHIDVFCNEATDFRIGFQRHEAGAAGPKEWYFPMIEKTAMTPGKWYSIDYSLDDDFLGEEGYGTGNECVAHYLRFGGEVQLGDYVPTWSNEIYFTNFVLLGDGCTPTAIGGKVIDDTGIALPAKASGFNAYVVSNELRYSAGESIRNIGIYNLAGQIVKTVPVNNLSSKTDVAALASGVYIVSADLANGQKVQAKITVGK